ncbi:MAG: HAD family hydrolase [Vulcanimicrobiota bacterium]
MSAPPVFLDFDGVIVDSLHIYIELFKNLCTQHSKRLLYEDVEEFRGWYEANWEINFFDLGFTNEEYLAVCEGLTEIVDYTRTRFFEGIPEMLRTLSETNPLVVVSTARTESIVERLRSAGLLGYFQAVTGSDDGSSGKVARLAALKSGIGATTGVMVGDTDHDIEAGRANKLITVGVTYGWITPARVKAARPDFLVDQPGDLPAAIQEALKACTPADIPSFEA